MLSSGNKVIIIIIINVSFTSRLVSFLQFTPLWFFLDPVPIHSDQGPIYIYNFVNIS